ncbi:DNA topoisomerase 2-binding protein 1-A-like [Gigantopelta aegis]|uniref:DNA topoisomerase 2-binding protein 1-A-like n=1 Tax=Gigantopelta aegis TaxID=1735272 RepID=UPI001B889824|nr:DNA topoisomerase 2-binding protein 1-A-like [Gigantopelta aegis]
MSDASFKVKCVRPENKEQIDGSLFEAFKSLKDHGFSPVCGSVEECLEVEQKEKDCVYLMDPFEGRAFQHLSALGCRIFGPQCVLSCLLAKMEIPRRRVPIYNLAMKDIVVSCSNLDKDTREEIHKKVELMCGEVSRVFTEIVTHLVVGEVGSKKYLVAAELGKQIMLPQWVDDVWEKAMYRHVHCHDDQFEKHKCPVFMGLVITVSGLDIEERKEIQKIVEAEGGSYSGEMKLKETTHLVLKEPKGQKYEHAKKWKINIVRTTWLYESVEKGYCLNEADFWIENKTDHNTSRSVKTSTPDKEKSTIEMSRLGDISTISNISAIGRVNNANRFCQSRFSIGRGDNLLTQLDLTTAPNNQFLDGCKIYLSGFRSPILEKLRKIINAGGATRFSSIDENLTHVIMGEKLESDIKQLRENHLKPFVVTPSWLAECFTEGRRVDEEQHQCLELSPLDEPTSPVQKKKRKKADVSKQLKPVSNQAAEAEEHEDDMEDIMSQYLPQPDDTTVKDDEKATDANDGEQTQDPSVNPDNTTLADEVDGDHTEEANGGIFHRKIFIFFGFEEEETKELGDYIVERGGRVVSENQRRIADYGIVPITGYPVTTTVTEIVTNAWLQMSIEQNDLLPVGGNELFRPIDLASGIDELQPLKGCVLSVSGYTGTERNCLTFLIEILGARCQEYFVRKANKMLDASTHLIVREPEGTKYETAKKWKLPAVSKQWLFVCARTGKRALDSDYLIDKIFNKTSEEETGHTKQADTNADKTSHKNDVEDQTNKTSRAKRSDSKTDVPPGECQIEITDFESKPESIVKGTKRSLALKTKTDQSSLESGLRVESDAAGVETNDNGKGEFVASSSAENSENLPVTIDDPMAKAKELLKTNKLQDSQKENVSRRSTRNTPLSSKPQHCKLKDLQQMTPKSLRSSEAGIDTPGKFLAPGVQFRPKFNLTAAYAMLETPPGEKKPNRRTSTSLKELFRDSMKVMVKNSSLPRRDKVTLDGNLKPNSEFEDEGPLEGVVIAVSQKLSHLQAEYNDIVSELGGSYSWNYTLSCTHYIFQGRANDKNKDFRNARDRGKIIVSPYWLYACKEQKLRVDEAQFPHNYNPNLSLVVSTRSTPARSTRRVAKSTAKAVDTDIESCAAATTKEKPAEMEKDPDVKKLDFEESKSDASPPSVRPSKRPSPLSLPRQAVAHGGGSSSSEEENNRLNNKEEEKQKECVAPDMGSTLEIREVLSKQIETMMSSSGKKGTKRRTKKLDSSGQLNTSGNTSDSSRSRPSSRQNRWSLKEDKKEVASKRSRRSGSRSSDNLSAPEASQSVQVTWDDPTGRLEQEKLAEKLEHAFSPSQNTDDFIADMDLPNDSDFTLANDNLMKRNDKSVKIRVSTSKGDRRSQEPRTPTPEAPPLAFPGPKPTTAVMSPQPVELVDDDSCDTTGQHRLPRQLVFLVSGMQQAERVDYGALIEQLGGRLLDTQNFDQSCTHLIVEQPARNEKVLAAIASGKWVLHKSYFEACRQENKFVKEDSHEWGSEFTSRIMSNLTHQASKLAAACHRWRQKVKELRKLNPHCKGAFDGWRVLLCSDKKRENNFRRLLEAGGADVLSLKPPFSSDVSASHAFLELHKVALSQEDLEHLVVGGVHCVIPDYIASYLTDDPLPSVEDFCPPEISALKASLPDKSTKKRKNTTSSSSDTSIKRQHRH